MAYTVNVQPRAMADIRNVIAWLTRHRSAGVASRWHAGLLAAVRTLEQNPDRCPLADEAADLGVELRELLYRKWRTVYRVLFVADAQTVDVLRVRHAAQDRLAPGDV